ADILCLLDGAKEAHRLLVVAAVPARRAIRRRQQSSPLVVAQSVSTLTPARSATSPTLTPLTLDPYLGTEVNCVRRRTSLRIDSDLSPVVVARLAPQIRGRAESDAPPELRSRLQ